MTDIKEKIRPTLVGLQVGEAAAFHISRMKGVRSQASEIGVIMDRRYKTRTDRERHVIIVERIL